MTGITYIKNQKGESTHIVFDLAAYGEALKTFLEDLQDIETIKATAQEETYTLVEAIKELGKQGVLSKEELQKRADV